jgi:glutamine synthetase
MLREDLIFVGTCDIAGHVRGKGFPARELPARRKRGVGWTHSNLMQTAFGPILDTPFGTGGDLMVVPDMSAEARVDFGDGLAPEHFFLGDVRNTDESAWECCPREFLRRAVAALDAASGLISTPLSSRSLSTPGSRIVPAMPIASAPGGARVDSAEA